VFSMLKDGKYAAWFRTSRGEGTGIVHLTSGKISGGDSIFTYGGSYEIDEDRFTATLTTRRHSAGPPTVFGIDEIEVTLTGTFNGGMASCSGTAEQAPGVVFEATLFVGQDQSPESHMKRAAVNFNADKLPKGSDRRWRERNPFARGLSRS
jgi:hypothetical protein